MDILNKDFKDIFIYFKDSYKSVSITSEKRNFKSFLKVEIESKINIIISDEDNYYLANISFDENEDNFLIFSFKSATEFITKFKLHKEWEIFVDEHN